MTHLFASGRMPSDLETSKAASPSTVSVMGKYKQPLSCLPKIKLLIQMHCGLPNQTDRYA